MGAGDEVIPKCKGKLSDDRERSSVLFPSMTMSTLPPYFRPHNPYAVALPGRRRMPSQAGGMLGAGSSCPIDGGM
jgi:hypothetical protein